MPPSRGRNAIPRSKNVVCLLINTGNSSRSFTPYDVYSLKQINIEKISFDTLLSHVERPVVGMHFDIPESKYNRFTLKLPSFSVDGYLYELSEIEFVPDTSWYFMTLNC